MTMSHAAAMSSGEDFLTSVVSAMRLLLMKEDGGGTSTPPN